MCLSYASTSSDPLHLLYVRLVMSGGCQLRRSEGLTSTQISGLGGWMLAALFSLDLCQAWGEGGAVL